MRRKYLQRLLVVVASQSGNASPPHVFFIPFFFMCYLFYFYFFFYPLALSSRFSHLSAEYYDDVLTFGQKVLRPT